MTIQQSDSINHSPLYNKVCFDLDGDQFDDLDFDNLLHDAYNVSKKDKDKELEYFCLRTGMMVAKLHTLQSRVRNFLNDDKCWKQTLATFKSIGTGKHHALCIYNTNLRLCDCGLLAILEGETK